MSDYKGLRVWHASYPQRNNLGQPIPTGTILEIDGTKGLVQWDANDPDLTFPEWCNLRELETYGQHVAV